MQGTSTVAIAAAVLVAMPAGAFAAPPGNIITDSGPASVTSVTDGLTWPWGMAFLPDGRILVTEKPGRLRIVDDGELSDPVEGTPEVFAEGQGGLLDVALDPDFEENGFVYLSFAEPREGGAGTSLGRGRLVEGRLEDFEVIFRQEPAVPGPNHFGGRIVFSPDGLLFLTLGDRFKFDPAQDLSNHLGAVVRIAPDGSVPEDNPFVGQDDAEDAIYSYGHRNIESAIWDPATRSVWVGEMGPFGGDELNRIEEGANYGWPVVSWGRHYFQPGVPNSGEEIPDPPTRPEFEGSALHWTPVISPSGMTHYDGDVFPQWEGSAFLGSLTFGGLVRVEIGEDGAREVERIPFVTRIRDVETGPDGFVYVLTDQEDGELWRIEPLG